MRGLVLTVLFMWIGPLAYASECAVPGLARGGNWVQIQEIERAFRCVISELEELQRQQRSITELEKEVAALKRRIPSEYLNENGKITAIPGRLIGKATFVLDASRSGKPFSLPLAQNVIEDLCARTNCHVLLSMRVTGVFSDAAISQAAVGPCGFSYDLRSGRWTLASGCATGATGGTDGDTSATRSNVIMDAGQACLFADTEITSRPGQDPIRFGPDRSKGFFLTAVPDLRPDITRPYRCVLEVFRTSVF